jgi:hypothetical protein
MRAILLLVLLTTLLPPLAAHANDNELSAGSSTRSLRSSSADALTGDALVGGGIGIARGLDVGSAAGDVRDHMRLWATSDITWASADGTMFQTLSTHMFDTMLTAGARLRYTPYRFVAMSAGLALGAQHESVRLIDSSDNASDTGWGAVARGSLQADLMAESQHISFGLRFEVGYVAASGVGLTPKQERTGDMLTIPVTEASIGHLDLSGPYMNVGLVAQF